MFVKSSALACLCAKRAKLLRKLFDSTYKKVYTRDRKGAKVRLNESALESVSMCFEGPGLSESGACGAHPKPAELDRVPLEAKGDPDRTRCLEEQGRSRILFSLS